MSIEKRFDVPFVARMALREKQIQQAYRPIIGVHKWFARRPGTVFRALLLSEFVEGPLEHNYYAGHNLSHLVVADPFMGGGTPLIEANRIGANVVGFDINPMSYWIVRQELADLDIAAFIETAEVVLERADGEIGHFYKTTCTRCGYENATVKYALWVKQERCEKCGNLSDLFPGHLVAQNKRHTHYVVACHACGELNELDHLPSDDHRPVCKACGAELRIEGNATRGSYTCLSCGNDGRYLTAESRPEPHPQRLFALEYHCPVCSAQKGFKGRLFKAPDARDLANVEEARRQLAKRGDLLKLIPTEAVPAGDETTRLHRWGYHYYQDLFSPRQLLSLTTLFGLLLDLPSSPVKDALLTVFSDTLRYQNALCRYDTYALKVQDIFSVHGYPTGLVRAEAHPLGLPGIGSGGFRHFIAKYAKAKRYCHAPFEHIYDEGPQPLLPTAAKKRLRGRRIAIPGEKIRARFVKNIAERSGRLAVLRTQDAATASFPPNSFDIVLTDPPYFDNVQYAELMDFHYVWLRRAYPQLPEFQSPSTRSEKELTGNSSQGKGLEHFARGLSDAFSRFASGLVHGGAFVFTYHHNDPSAYYPPVVALLNARLYCTSVLPVPAEMGASMHIKGTASSVLDSVFVCRKGVVQPKIGRRSLLAKVRTQLAEDVSALRSAGLEVTRGDIACLLYGHVSRATVSELYADWDTELGVRAQLSAVEHVFLKTLDALSAQHLVERLVGGGDLTVGSAHVG